MTSEYQRIEEAISNAIEFQHSQPEPLKVTHLASLYDVPYQRLTRRLAGGKSKSTRDPTNTRFTAAQEQAIVTHLEQCEVQDNELTTTQVIAIKANEILASAHTDPTTPRPRVSPMWARRFLNRHPEIKPWKVRRPQPARNESEGDADAHDHGAASPDTPPLVHKRHIREDPRKKWERLAKRAEDRAFAHRCAAVVAMIEPVEWRDINEDARKFVTPVWLRVMSQLLSKNRVPLKRIVSCQGSVECTALACKNGLCRLR